MRVQVGQQVQAGQELVVLESMKMEITVNAPQAGVVREVRAQPGASVRAGQCVVVIEANRGDSTR
ncbi:acetyl-CoA carboxylase biotin carboxyl carrier protein subunit [Achromobacter xylosoxidans]